MTTLAQPPTVPPPPDHFPLAGWNAERRVSRLLHRWFASVDAGVMAAIDPGPPMAAGTLGPELDAIEAQQTKLKDDPARLKRILHQDANFPDLLLEACGLSNEKLRTTPALQSLWAICSIAIAATSPLTQTFKERYDRPRPYHLRPGRIVPQVNPPPGHPAYPSGHATQTYLGALALTRVIFPIDKDETARRRVFETAFDVAVNREYAGLHYVSDSDAGRRFAHALMPFVFHHFAETFMVADRDWRAHRGEHPGPTKALGPGNPAGSQLTPPAP